MAVGLEERKEATVCTLQDTIQNGDVLLDGSNSLIHERSRTWSNAIDDLLRISKLADDWDGMGALAPDRVCRKALPAN